MTNDTYTPWWEEQAESLGGKTSRRPISEQLRERLGEWSFAGRAHSIGGNPVTDRLAEIANRVARPANVVRNADHGEERVLKIGWSDGTKSNRPDDNTIWLSPDAVLKSRIDTMSEDEVVDAMTGQALMCGTMKRTISMESWNQATTTEPNKPAATIWQAFESAIARADVLKNWPGCADYFKRHAKKNIASKDAVQKALDEYKPSVELAAAALAWNIQWPANKVTLSPRYQRAVDLAVKYLDRKHEAYERYAMCLDAARILAEALTEPPKGGEKEKVESEGQGNTTNGQGNKDESSDKDESNNSDNKDKNDEQKNEPQPEQQPEEKPETEDSEEGGDSDGGEDNGSGEGEDEDGGSGEADSDPGESDEATDAGNDGQSDGPGESDAEEDEEGGSESGQGGDAEPDDSGPDPDDGKPEGPAPDVTDGSLFGESIETEKAKAEDLPPSQEVKATGNPGENNVLPEGLCDHTDTRVVFIEESNGTWFNAEARAMATQIRAIQNALRFRNNDLTMFNRGCSSGELDEGSLDKLALNENNPAIWERRELAGQPKIAVGLLLDESGSMAGAEIEAARRVCVAMAAALMKIRGVSTMLLGHKGDRGAWMNSDGTMTVQETQAKGEGCQVTIKEYLTTKHKNPYAIQHTQAGGNNYDSFALDYAVRKMVTDYPTHERRVMFLVSDGQPAGQGGIDKDGTRRRYGGTPALNHVRQVCEWGRRHKVMVCGIGIKDAYSEMVGEMMFGKGNFVVLHDVMSSLSILTAFLKQIAARA
jgi:cobalamin biosynthesis protein CobT